MKLSRLKAWLATVAMGGCLAMMSSQSAAIDIVLDYTYDSNNFFSTGNPEGPTAKAALEAAAGFYSGILGDTFSEISTPADFASSVSNGVANWTWNLSFGHPGTSGQVTLTDQTIPADEYRIYVGAKTIAGSTLGVGGPGGWGYASDNNGGGFSSSEINQLTTITNSFFDSVETRGEASGFANWGGALTFDSSTSNNWHFDHLSEPAHNKLDFYSVAIHELGHALGLGASDEWNALRSGTNFTGAASTAEHGGAVPLFCDGACGHWAEDTESTIFGTSTLQETAMDPNITQGQRKRLTTLDAAALTDIGWNVSAPSFGPGDYNTDGSVNGADLATWQSRYDSSDLDGTDFLTWQRNYQPGSTVQAVPEPSSLLLAACVALVVSGTRFSVATKRNA